MSYTIEVLVKCEDDSCVNNLDIGCNCRSIVISAGGKCLRFIDKTELPEDV